MWGGTSIGHGRYRGVEPTVLWTFGNTPTGSADLHSDYANSLIGTGGRPPYLHTCKRHCGAASNIGLKTVTAIASSSTKPRRSPNRERLIARVAVWTLGFPVAALIVTHLIF